ncbi:MAG: hypothetical protein ACYTGX_11900 [Planctomycetota bacterium]
MFNRAVMLGVLGATLVAAPALAGGGEEMVGEVAPDVEIKEWLGGNAACKTLKDLRGKAVLIEFFSTT